MQKQNAPFNPIKEKGDTASEMSDRVIAASTIQSNNKGGQVTISPPANVNSPYKVLSSGIDTLVLAINVLWETDTLFSYLADLKSKAQGQDTEVEGILEAKNIGELKFSVKPHGSDGYEWLLTNKAFSLRIGNWRKPKSRPSIMAEIRSEALWRLGVKECVYGLITLIENYGGRIRSTNPSRVDLCIDMIFPCKNWKMDIISYRVTRAQKSQVYLQNDRFTGFMIGSGKIVARAYDKPFEIERNSKKTWMYSIWDMPTIPDDQRVIRFEFQIRREALKELGIDSFNDLINHQHNLWSYCTHNWLKFMDNRGKHHVTQRNILDWWTNVQNGYTGAQDAYPLVRGTAFRKDREQLFKQSQGLLTSLVALHLEETCQDGKEIDFNDLLLANYESAFNDCENESFQQKVEKKYHKYQRLALKQRQTHNERKTHGFPF